MNDPRFKSFQSPKTKPQLHHYTYITPIYTHKQFGPSRTCLSEQWPSNQLIWGRDATALLCLLICNARPFLSTFGLDPQPQYPPLAHSRKHSIKTKSFPGCPSHGAHEGVRITEEVISAGPGTGMGEMLDDAGPSSSLFWPHKLLALRSLPCLQWNKKEGGRSLHL